MIGMLRSTSVAPLLDGSVLLFALGSSPTSAIAPPLCEVPANVA